jgi:hypothetical protein
MMRQSVGGLPRKPQSFIEILKSDDKMMEVFVWSRLLKLSKFIARLFGEDFALLGCNVEKLVIFFTNVSGHLIGPIS